MTNKFKKKPTVKMPNHLIAYDGWAEIRKQLKTEIEKIKNTKKTIVVEFYHGVDNIELSEELFDAISCSYTLNSEQALKPEKEIYEMVNPDVTDDRIFGRLTQLKLSDYFETSKIDIFQKEMKSVHEGIVLISGIGASLVQPQFDLLIYVDMARWEIQLRMRQNQVNSIGLSNRNIEYSHLYKQGYFVDWRICDHHKIEIMGQMDFILDTNTKGKPKMIARQTFHKSLSITNKQPFSLVPFFDPGPWGGQWMQKKFQLDESQPNFAWCFNCVPEENSLLLEFDNTVFETPSINLVLFEPEALLGNNVYKRFGREFPIRFDFLDTMGGGNLSLQVHPTDDYIKEKFGMDYTQDESYYIMDAGPDAVVYLGIKDDTDSEEMIDALKSAEKGKSSFDTDKYIPSWPIKKHDHLLIPAGTIHCSGKDSMVLEISATPYIFTFKLWDWGRLGLDGKPRPINVEHGKQVINWERREAWTKKNLINAFEEIENKNGVLEEKTGLHELQFIETIRYWFNTQINHHTKGNLNVICLIDGEQIVVESPNSEFAPFLVNYAETFIVPANIGAYTIKPIGTSEGKQVAVLKAYVKN